MLGRWSKAIKIGDVKTPIIEKAIPINPAVYSFFDIANTPNINAMGLKINEKIKIPIKPKVILKTP